MKAKSLAASLAAFAQDLPAGPQRSELEHLIAVRSDEGQRQMIRARAMIYPFVVFSLCAVVLLFLCVSVIPTFAKMFNEFGLVVPRLTSLVIALSEQILHHPIRLIVWIVVLGTVAYVGLRLLRYFAVGTRFFGLLYSGTTSQLIAMAEICSRLADLLNEREPLPSALRSAADDCSNSYYSLALRVLANDAQQGALAIRRSSVAHNFPANLIYALSAEPEGAANIPLLRTLADLYREQADRRWDFQSGFTGPLAIVALGLLVAVVVVSLFQPLISLVSGLS